MVLRPFVICSYLMTAYWISYHFPSMRMVFYPTLGAFSFLFMKRGGQLGHVSRIIAGACIASFIGSAMYMLQPGAWSFFVTAFVTMTLIQACKWDAAPILAVSLIPYFAHPTNLWTLPLAVGITLSGLIIPLWVLERLEGTGWLSVLEQFPQRVFRSKQSGGANSSSTQL